MDSNYIRECLNEWQFLREDFSAGRFSLLETALYVEEVFGIVLAEKEITPENLDSRPALEKLILGKLAQRAQSAD